MTWFNTTTGFKPPSTEQEFLISGNNRITNTYDGSDRITKKVFSTLDGATYKDRWELVYTYDGADTAPLTITGQEPTIIT